MEPNSSPWDAKAKGDEAMLLNHTAKVLAAVPQKRQIITGLQANAIAVPDWLVAGDYFTSAEVEQLYCDFCDWREGSDMLTAELPGEVPEKTVHLDARGIVRPGTTVRRGMILVGKLSPRAGSDDLTPEEKMLHAIYGTVEDRRINNSLVYGRQDEGVVTRAQLLSPMRMQCPEHGDVHPTRERKCPYCQLSLPGDIQHDNIIGPARMQVVIEIQIRRPLQLGDILEMPNGESCTVTQIINSNLVSHGEDVAILFAKGSEAIPASHFHRSGMVKRSGKNAGKCLMDTMRVRKKPLFAEDKVSSRATGLYSSVTQLPLGNDPDHPAPRVKRAVLLELLRQGYRENVRELLGIKADAADARVEAYESLVKGVLLDHPQGTPETTRRLEALLAAMMIPACKNDKASSLTHDQTSIEATHQMLVRCASPKETRKISWGRVMSPDTIDKRILQPFRNGLYCQKIFGPDRDWECACGKYRGMKYKGMVCDRCGVKIASSRVRRRRFGTIELPAPIIHPFFYQVIQERLQLDEGAFANIVYCQPDSMQTRKQLPELLKEVSLEPDRILLRELLVFPADLRPMFRRGDEWVMSDLTDLYRRIVNRAQRLKKLINLKAPEVIITNEIRQLQMSVTSLFLNDSLDKPVLGSGGHPLAGLWWHFERLLKVMIDKRVDYAANGIVIPDESIPAGCIGLPTQVAEKMFGPQAIRVIRTSGLADTIKAAHRLLEKGSGTDENVQTALGQALKDRPVLTVTRTGAAKPLQAVVAEGEVLRVSPDDAQELNLRFDGERLTVHVPITKAAVDELQSPQPLDDVSSKIEELTAGKLVEYALGDDPIPLTEVDRILLGIR